MGNISLIDNPKKIVPKTYEEWAKIHGNELEYLGEKKKISKNKIKVVNIKKEARESLLDINQLYIEVNGNKTFNYPYYCQKYIEYNKLITYHGVCYTPDGAMTEAEIRHDIYENLTSDIGWTGKLDSHISSLCKMIKDKSCITKWKPKSVIIPCLNGDLHINKSQWVFYKNKKEIVPYRLSVNYTEDKKPTPLFTKWLTDLFDPDDISTIQQMFGYCLLPTTTLQEAFIIVGEGGTGKSGIGVILNAIMGNAIVNVDTQKLISERFQLASIENKLIAYDDDLGSGALAETGLLKKIVTADQPLSAEKKGQDIYEFQPFARLIMCTNFMISSLYDDSDGFYRRLHPIDVLPKNKNKKIIKNFYEKIIKEEKEQIFKWALEGLRQLIENGWEMHWSMRSKVYLKNYKQNVTHFSMFLQDTCDFNPEEKVPMKDLKKVYTSWCRENGIKELSSRRFELWLANNQSDLKIHKTRYRNENNRQIRGYEGIKIKSEWETDAIMF